MLQATGDEAALAQVITAVFLDDDTAAVVGSTQDFQAINVFKSSLSAVLSNVVVAGGIAKLPVGSVHILTFSSQFNLSRHVSFALVDKILSRERSREAFICRQCVQSLGDLQDIVVTKVTSGRALNVRREARASVLHRRRREDEHK